MLDTLPRIPGGGVARRRAKAIRNREALRDADVQRAFDRDTFPELAIAAGGCTCGWKHWPMPGATDEDWAAYHQEADDHAYRHDLEDSA